MVIIKKNSAFIISRKASKLMIQKTNKNIPRRNNYILENILLNIFQFYILKYIIKFFQNHGNNKKNLLP